MSVNSSHCPPTCRITPWDEDASFELRHPFANVSNLLSCLLRSSLCAHFRKPTFSASAFSTVVNLGNEEAEDWGGEAVK